MVVLSICYWMCGLFLMFILPSIMYVNWIQVPKCSVSLKLWSQNLHTNWQQWQQYHKERSLKEFRAIIPVVICLSDIHTHTDARTHTLSASRVRMKQNRQLKWGHHVCQSLSLNLCRSHTWQTGVQPLQSLFSLEQDWTDSLTRWHIHWWIQIFRKINHLNPLLTNSIIWFQKP